MLYRYLTDILRYWGSLEESVMASTPDGGGENDITKYHCAEIIIVLVSETVIDMPQIIDT